MIIFPLVSIPLFGLLIASLYRIDIDESKRQIKFFGKGALTFVPALILSVILGRLISISYKPASHFFYLFFTEHFLYFVIAVAGFILFQGLIKLNKTTLLEFSLFSVGYYSLVSLQTVIKLNGELSGYQIFILPVVRMALILLSALFLIKILNSYGFMMAGYAFAFFLLPFAACLVSYLHQTNRVALASLFSGLLLILAFCLWYFLRE